MDNEKGVGGYAVDVRRRVFSEARSLMKVCVFRPVVSSWNVTCCIPFGTVGDPTYSAVCAQGFDRHYSEQVYIGFSIGVDTCP